MKQSRRKALTTIRIKKMVRRRLQENLNPQRMKATSARVTEVMDELRKQYGEGVGIAKAQICAVVDKYSEALKEIPRPRKRRVVKYSMIVDGLENEAERQRMPDGFRVATKCPDCEVVQEGSMFLGVASKIVIKCAECKHEAPLSEFRKETPGYGGS